MSRLLLLVTSQSYRAGAFLTAARAVGVDVVVGTDRRQALAALNPGGHLTLDFDAPERAVEDVLAYAERQELDGVLAADDDGVILSARTGAALGLRHHPVEAVMACRDKYLLRAALERAGLPAPHCQRVALDEDPAVAAAAAPYPCVLKPAALSGSRGVIRADDPAAFVTAFRRVAAILARRDAAPLPGGADRFVLVERYLPGPEVALEGLLTHGRLRTLALFDKPDPLEGPFFEETIYVTPSRLAPSLQEAIVDAVARACAAIGLGDGPVHAELRLPEGRPTVIEIGARSIGGLCSRALRFDGGMSLEELVLRHALGIEGAGAKRETRAAGVMMLPIPSAGVLEAVGGQDEARAVAGIDDLRLTIPLGHPVEPLPEGARYLGFLFARAATPGEVEAALREAHRRLTIVIAPPMTVGRVSDAAGENR